MTWRYAIVALLIALAAYALIHSFETLLALLIVLGILSLGAFAVLIFCLLCAGADVLLEGDHDDDRR